MRPAATGTVLLVFLASCLGDPVGPRGTIALQRVGDTDSLLVGTPGEALAKPVAFVLVDGDGRSVPAASVKWEVVSGNGRVEQASSVSDKDGHLSAVWILGTRASELQQLTADVTIGSHQASAQLQAKAVPVNVVSLAFQSETTDVRLTVGAQLSVIASDPYGNTFHPNYLRFTSLDTTVTVDSAGVATAHRRGFARVSASSGIVTATTVVHGIQVVNAIEVDRDTVRFHSLGQNVSLAVTLRDDQGLPVLDSLPAVIPSDTSVVAVTPATPIQVRSQTNGTATITLATGRVIRTVVAVVQQRAASLAFADSSYSFDALGDTVHARVVVLDSLGVPVQTPRITFTSSDSGVVAIDTTGFVITRGNGSAVIRAQSVSGVTATAAALVEQRVRRIGIGRDTLLFDALHSVLPLHAVAFDRLGVVVVGAMLDYSSTGGGVAKVDSAGEIEALANGTTLVVASHGADSAAAVVRVQQRPVRVLLGSDTVRFVALGETDAITAVAVDSLGYPVSSHISGVSIADLSIAQLLDSVTVKSFANGTTTASFTVAGLPGTMTVLVHQIATTIRATVDSGELIVSLPQDSLIPLSCRAFDRNAQPIATAPVVGASASARWSGSACENLRIRRSGIDTIRVSLDSVTTLVPIVLAVRPIVSSAIGDFLVADSIPSGTRPWAPSARLTPAGVLEVYTALQDLTNPDVPSNLHRFTSVDGATFVYDGLMLARDSDSCALNGTGIENVAVVPRADSAGWRMYYSSGSDACYGWQVFSAVSGDGRTWVKEPGIRLSNGGALPPEAPTTPPWPVGEGMSVDRLPSGEWRMIAGTYEHVLPRVDLWQIAEWRSLDQLSWTYVNTVFTTRDMPVEGQGSVYSPTIDQFAPGMWRMIFTADNRGTGQPFQSRLWSAVSLDQVHWQFEGELMGMPGTNLYYCALAGDRLVFIRQDSGQPFRLAVATVTMP